MKLLFKLSGSIAAYKACMVISRLVQDGWEVQTIASPSALQFIGTATLEGLTGKTVITSLYQEGQQMDHIHLNRWADAVILCPATASTINAYAAGTGDNLLTSFFLAHDFSKPYFIAPAMNRAMIAHPATRHSLAKLKEWGVQMIEGAAGHQACGEIGMGRMAEPDEIIATLKKALL